MKGPQYIVCDNLASHFSPEVATELKAFKVLRLPPYSSFLSSVETVFAVLKKRIAKHMARLGKELDQDEFEAEIQ
jgi:transposase